jgi:hypothetical protein
MFPFGSSSNLVGDVQFWLDNPEMNHGWILISQAEPTMQTARRFGSREDTGDAPVLEVGYTPPSAAELRISQFSLQGTNLLLGWTGGSPLYQLQMKSSLQDTNWVDVSERLNTNSTLMEVSGSSGFLRVAGGLGQ